MASGSVFLNNLDDFIVPSQACINPYVTGKASKEGSDKTEPVTRQTKKHRITLETDDNDPYDLSKSDFKAPVTIEPNLIQKRVSTDTKVVATVSLNDCLACSGCVTSAETVLIQEQSSQKLLQLLEEKNPNVTVVVQISPNSRASIAQFLGISKQEFFLKVATILKQQGVKYVLDSSSGADVAMFESREEFIHRFKNGQRIPEWKKPPYSSSVSATTVMHYPSGKHNPIDPSATTTETVGFPSLSMTLPILTSHCPGWVCYAEKSAPEAIPFLSTVKSPQQIIGSVIKSVLTNQSELTDMIQFLNGLTLQNMSLDNQTLTSSETNHATKQRIYVVSIQPCYDKKLEASRKDFYHAERDIQEVDLVLSTTELWQMLELFAWKWSLEQQRAAWMDCETTTSSTGNSQKTAAATDKVVMMDMENIGVDLDDPDAQALGLLVKRSRSSTTEESPKAAAIRSAFAHVYDYFEQTPLDAIHGQDSIESLFRSFSEDGLAFLTAAETNSASGGYTDYLFKYIADVFYGYDLYRYTLPYREGRNPDMTELDLQSILQAIGPNLQRTTTDGSQPQLTVEQHNLKMGKAYGFRNIQSILLKMRRKQSDFDYIEVMACPSGCNNGGGQLKSLSSILPVSTAVSNPLPPRPEAPQESRDRIAQVDTLYHEQLVFRRPEESPLVQYLYRQDRLGQPLSDAARATLHTRYHAVPALETIAPLAAKR